jgi:succinate dehydrogenase/fumarate reductase flavoprotein subunit
MIVAASQLKDGGEYDVIVVGAGAGGLAAALFAAIAGKSALVVERTEYVGGTSALSAGTAWLPLSRHAGAVNPADDRATVSKFLDQVVGNYAPRALREAFLDSAAQAVATLEANSDVKFRPYPLHPDYEQLAEGASLNGRALEPEPFDARPLGSALDALRPPIPEFTVLGGMMVDRRDINHLLAMTKSWDSAKHSAMILARYGVDRLSGRRGTRLVMGNALIGRFLLSLQKRKVEIVTRCEVESLLYEGGRVTGLTLSGGGATRSLRARAGVVLAAGGYGRDPARRAELLHQPTPAHSPTAPGHTGRAQALALELGARFAEGGADNAFWAPVSVRRRADGSTAVFPHFVLDRSKPGAVCVDQSGRRFVNESSSYHVFARAMFETNRTRSCIPCYLITDSVGMWSYGLGMARMRTKDLSPFLADGYLVAADTVEQLAQKLGMDAGPLTNTIAAMNQFAATGVDTEFGRGTTAYHRVNGDPAHKPNPTLGPIGKPPFYAVRLYPGDIGAANGLAIDEWSRVLGEGDRPIPGLYACGAEAASIMGGTYPGPGITIGPAIAFGYRAIEHALGRAS